jgi:hypothetical protein
MCLAKVCARERTVAMWLSFCGKAEQYTCNIRTGENFLPEAKHTQLPDYGPRDFSLFA